MCFNNTILLILFLLLANSCKKQERPLSKSFHGEQKAVGLADQMFNAIGGKAAWCELKSLYIKAEHTEPQMTIPYQSEIWRGIDRFELIIEQQNDSFHVKGVFNDDEGKIRYYDKRDTSRVLTEEQLRDWEYDHNHNVYVLLHNLGCSPEKYSVQLYTQNRIDFYRDTTFVTGFGLDKKMRPHLFYQPTKEGTISASTFTHWGLDDELVHSAGGHPLDSNFVYLTDIWQPSKVSLTEIFGAAIFELD